RAAALAGTLGATTEVRPILDALGRTFGKIYRERDLEISVEAEDGLRFRGEKQDFEEMAGNLIDNACKWAASRVAITAALDEADGRPVLRIAVEDDGPGLPDEARQEVLERGKRLDETKPGSGLGLSIVADLVAHYRGRVELTRSRFGGARAELDLLGDAA
ncbi:MAG: sensor histidine kinase, partial [Methylobacteriaceae bacterium]|nr:sensor histidine kinase [Methylobacteriaceae bacterium]